MCDLLREAENQCAACPKWCQPAAGITAYQSYSSFLWAATSVKWREHHKEAMREQEPTLLSFPGHHWHITLVSRNFSSIDRPGNHLKYFKNFQNYFPTKVFMIRFIFFTGRENLQLPWRSVDFTFQNCAFKMLNFRLFFLQTLNIYILIYRLLFFKQLLLTLIHSA